ncbi:MAG: ATP-binding cassette domain-containing protein [Clostridiales bacterium]|nr:ATP-binding cassette domain-containing protein [Clostridiales bacterium]
MLTLEGVSKTFSPGTVNEKQALREVDLQLEDGDFVTVIGSNGAGKSTLFGAIAGSFVTDRGRIELDGMNLVPLKEHRRARYIGRLFQDPLKGTAPSMTVEENLALAYSRGKRRGFSLGIPRRDAASFRELLAAMGLGLENRMKTRVGLLSGGQRQTLTLLMAVINTPRLLLLDEHTAALDPATATRVMDITREVVGREQITTLMITHNLKDALAIGNRTVMMDEGRVLLDLRGEERAGMSLDQLLALYSRESRRQFDNDRILLSTARDSHAQENHS